MSGLLPVTRIEARIFSEPRLEKSQEIWIHPQVQFTKPSNVTMRKGRPQTILLQRESLLELPASQSAYWQHLKLQILLRVQVADIFQHPLFRGDCVSQAFMVKETTTSEEQKCKREFMVKETTTSQEQKTKESCLGQETHKKCILFSGNLSFGLMSGNVRLLILIKKRVNNVQIFGSNCRKEGDRTVPECVDPTVKYGRGGVMVWGCFVTHKVLPHPKMKMLSLITYPHVVPNP